MGEEYHSKKNVGNVCKVENGRSDAFGVLALIMFWGTGTVVNAMLEMDARTLVASLPLSRFGGWIH